MRIEATASDLYMCCIYFTRIILTNSNFNVVKGSFVCTRHTTQVLYCTTRTAVAVQAVYILK